MKTHLCAKSNIKLFLLALPLCLLTLGGNAQSNNIAPAATASPFAGQQGDGIGSHGPWAFNDGFAGAYPGSTFVGTVGFGGTIEFTWPGMQTFNRIVFYKGTHAITGCAIEYDDGSGYKALTSYNSTTQPQADSITFAPVSALKLRFTKITGGGKGEALDFREIEVQHVADKGNACPTKLEAGTITPADENLCLGAQATLIASEYSFADDIKYQWQVNSAGTWKDIPDATNSWYSFRVTAATPADATYRLGVTCNGSTVYTAVPAHIRVTGGNDAKYASVPYFEDFEKPWANGCGTGDIPSASWTTTPTSGAHIWQRNDAIARPLSPLPNTPNGKFYAAFSSQFDKATVFDGHMDLHLDCSTVTGDKALFFYYVNPEDPKMPNPDGNDVLKISLSKDGGQTFEPLAAFTNQDDWGKKYVPIKSNAAKTIIRFTGRTQTAAKSREFTNIGVDSVYVAPPCSGSVTAGSISPSGTVSLCPGLATSLAGTGASQGGGITYQWEQSPNGNNPWTDASGGSGAGSLNYATPPLFGSMYYRLKVTCINGNNSQTTTAVKVDVDAPIYAPIPFMESFEDWGKRCDTLNNIPSNSWVNTPPTGMSSWRRNDDANEAWGYFTKWNPSGGNFIFADWYASNGKYFPAAFDGQHSARFHTTDNRNGIGKLDLFLDCSTQQGDKELSFALNLTKDIPPNGNNPNPAPNGYDYLNVYMSTDGGANFTLLEKYAGPAFSQWDIKSLVLPSNSAKTVIRFEAVSVTGYKDMGLDYVRVLPACKEKPVAGTIDSISPCIDKDFFLRLSGNSQSGGMSYKWQRATSNAGPWINMPGTESDAYKTQIQDSTWFRVIVTCDASGKSDTTAVRLIKPGPFYHCYCESGFNSEYTLNNNYSAPNFGMNIGNVTLVNIGGDTLMVGGDPVLNWDFTTPYLKHYSYPQPEFKAYTDYSYNVSPATLYLDSSYNFIIHAIYSSTVGNNPVKWAAYIDFNQDGLYDTASERIWIDLKNNQDIRQQVNGVPGKPLTTYSFSVPDTAKIGLTGMRVVMLGGMGARIDDWNNGPVPCGFYGDGETEDYLVNIENHPCNGAPDAGVTQISDTLMCPGYDIQLSNITHEADLSGISWDWQSSANGSSWSVIANSTGQDTITQTFTSDVFFRLRVVCSKSKDTAYSNVVHVGKKEAYKCYCYSMATGREQDTSDVGEFKFGIYAYGGPGPHLNNTTAINGRTDNTDSTLILYADSTYKVSVSHILRSAKHGDAKVTLFIDYDNNLKYDADELVWTDHTTASSWNLSKTITIPSDVTTDVPTGMRVILNNNTGPNVPSDEACGPYVSGETEDYVVLFYKKGTPPPNGITPLNASINDLKVYPNPTDGKVFLRYFGTPQEKAYINVLNITGQVLKTQEVSNVTNGHVMELDLGALAQGMYFIRFGTANEYVIRKLTLINQR